uniref:DNA damage-binding protein 2 n=1 Tax=Neogobius melanostomus TaxID=47308 RepID=A0A8C6WIR7_9GOBI
EKITRKERYVVSKPCAAKKKGVHQSILHYLYKSTLDRCLQKPFVRSLSSYHFHGADSPFDRRITCLEWHPTHPSTLAVGSKGGDIYLWDFEDTARKCLIHGKGAGDFIGGMKFCPTDLSKVYTASGEGTLSLNSFEGLPSTVVSRIVDCGHEHHNVCYWYCCLDVSVSSQMLATGDNVGNLFLLSMDGQKIFGEKLHKAKVTHAEFNPRCDWLLATSSVDHTVKLWDLRNIKDKNSFLYSLPHEKAVNLLTTDQYDQIRIYASSDWSKPQHVIQHPHRQFQHLTPIKATWHPTYDLIVAGRYPDDRVCPGDQRTVDIYDANSSELVNKFNPMGDVIGTGMGVTVLVWDRNESLVNSRHRQTAESSVPVDLLRGPRRSQARPRDRGAPRDTNLKKKLASLEEIQTKTKSKKK